MSRIIHRVELAQSNMVLSNKGSLGRKKLSMNICLFRPVGKVKMIITLSILHNALSLLSAGVLGKTRNSY